MRDSVTVHMRAPIEDVWDLVSDITRIGEFSPETFEAEWLQGATGPAVGNRFRGHVRRNQVGPVYWSVCEVTECVPNETFAFAVMGGGKRLNNWRYDLAESGDGVDVTESFRLEPGRLSTIYWSIMGRWRGKTNVEGMRATLERMKAVVEAGRS